ncbi:MAG TPA: hypothetical protein VMB50_07710, partial [Myxococcales bacterium]|nr:hypothetical protein [Myxococcales bacterium]
MVRTLSVAAAVALGAFLPGCWVLLPSGGCPDGGGCPEGTFCGGDGYCHVDGATGTTGRAGSSGSSTGSTAGGGSTGGSSTGAASSGGSTGGVSSSGGSSTGGSTGGPPCYCPTCSAAAGGIPLGPSDGGLTPRYGLAAVYLDRYIFAIGGVDSCGVPTPVVEFYDTSNPGGWQPTSTSHLDLPDLPMTAPLPVGWSFASAAGVIFSQNGASSYGLAVMGGESPGSVSSGAVAFSFGGDFWQSEGSLPEPLYAGAAVLNPSNPQCLELLGGLTNPDGGQASPTAAIETLCNPFNGQGVVSGVPWSTSTLALPSPIAYEAATQDSAGNTYVLGGEIPGVEVSEAVWVI